MKEKTHSERISIGINIGSFILALLVLFLPNLMSFYIALIYPPVLYILLLCCHRIFYNAEAKNALRKVPKSKLTGKAPFPFLGIDCFLLVAVFRAQLDNLEGHGLYTMLFGATAVLSAVVFIVHRKKMFVSSVIAIVCMILIGVYGEIYTVNSVTLRETGRYRTEVTGKLSTGGFRTRRKHYCKVLTPEGNEVNYEVTHSFYDQIKEGDEVIVVTETSALGFTVTQIFFEEDKNGNVICLIFFK